MKRYRRWVLGSTLLLFAGYACALRTFPPQVRVRLQWDPPAAAKRIGGPPDVYGMDCLVALATGPGINSSVSQADVGNRLPSCLGFGTNSPFALLGALTGPNGGVDLTLPAGAARVITLVGVKTNQPGACAAKTTVRDFFTGGTPSFYVVGKSPPTDFFQSGTVVINNIYSPGSAEDLVGICQPQGGGGTLTLTATKAYVGDSGAASAGVSFSDGLTFNLPPQNFSGGPMLEIAVASPPANLFTLPPTVGPLHARIDVLFDLTGIDLSAFNTLTLNATATGGTTAYGGTCAAVPFISAQDNWQMGFYENGLWMPIIPLADTINFNVPGDLTLLSTTEDGTPYLHISMRSGGIASPDCSGLRFGSLSAQLNP